MKKKLIELNQIIENFAQLATPCITCDVINTFESRHFANTATGMNVFMKVYNNYAR